MVKYGLIKSITRRLFISTSFWKVAFVVGLVFITLCCSYAQQFSGSILVNGKERSFIGFLPQHFDDIQSLALVINYHGTGSNGCQQAIYTGYNGIADTAGFVVCYPNADGIAFDLLGDKDIQFTNSLIELFVKNYKVDKCKICATGLSNGGFFSQKLACEIPDKIAAIASVAGTLSPLEVEKCRYSKGVPMMHVHGTADNIVNYNGLTNAFGSYIGVDSLMKFWRKANGCSNVKSIIPLPDINSGDMCTADLISYAMCEKETVLYRVNGGGHTWPGSLINIGVTSGDFNASKESWLFFKNKLLASCSTFTKDEQTNESPEIIYREGFLKIVWKSFEPRSYVNIIKTDGSTIRIKPDSVNTEINLTDTSNTLALLFIQLFDGKKFYVTKLIVH